MQLITIGYGRHLFAANNNERARMEHCAVAAGSLLMIIFTHRADGLERQSLDSGLTLHPTNSRSKFTMVFDALRIGRELLQKSNGPVIVSTQDPFEAGLVGYLLKRRFDVRLVVQEHGDVFSLSYWRTESLLNRVRYQLGKYILKRADIVRVVSSRIAATMRHLGVTAPIRQLPVAIDLSAFAPKVSPAATTDEKKSDTFWFLSVARFVPQKNLSLMVQAFAAAHKERPHLRLRLVGRGPERAVVEQFIGEQYSNLPPAEVPIVLEEWSDDVPGLMQQADAYLLTSNYEGWARVLIEAMVVELPVVTTDVGCAGEVLKHEEHGLVVPVADQAALTAAIIRLATDHALCTTLRHTLHTLEKRSLPGVNLPNYGQEWVKTLE
jgi:glycosyltransferase involved in cell wall biosynthesis